MGARAARRGVGRRRRPAGTARGGRGGLAAARPDAGLRSRLWAIGQEDQDNLEAALREEAGAADDDPLPHLIAGQLGRAHSAVMAVIRREMVKGRDPREVSREVLGLLGDIEEPLGEKALNYAVRGVV